jgi:hypothetical protein
MAKIHRHVSLAALAAPLLCAPWPARAADPSLSECISASENAIKLRSEGKLRESRAQSLLCVSDACPGELRDECKKRIVDLNAAIPTVVFEVKDGAGQELSAVKVTMDGQVVADRLGGMALTLDPGTHQFTFEATGEPPLSETIILHEGDKDRRERVTFGGSALAASAAAPPVTTSPGSRSPPPSSDSHGTSSPADDSGHGARVAGLVVGATGLVGLVAGSVFGGLSFSSWGQANSECPSHMGCSAQATNNRSDSLTFGTVSTVGFIAGGALLATGLTIYLTAPRDRATNVGVQLSPGGLGVSGRFE